MITLADTSRYLIYQLLRRKVDIHFFGKEPVSGIVDRVYRNIMENVVEVTLCGRCHVFDEPTHIFQNGNEVVFMYGCNSMEEQTDEQLFQEARLASHAGESVDDVLRRTQPAIKRELRIVLGERLPLRRRHAA